MCTPHDDNTTYPLPLSNLLCRRIGHWVQRVRNDESVEETNQRYSKSQSGSNATIDVAGSRKRRVKWTYRISSPTTIIDAANKVRPGCSLTTPFPDALPLSKTFLFILPALSNLPSRKRYAGLYMSLLWAGCSRLPYGLADGRESSIVIHRAPFGTVSWMLPMDVYLSMRTYYN